MRNLRKIIFVLLFLPLFLLGPFASAQESEPSDEATEAIEEETAEIQSTLPEPGLTPDSPLYFLDTLGENIDLALTRSPEAKAKKAFSRAEEKLAEAKDMAEKGKGEAAENATKRHDDYVEKATENLGKAKALGRDIEALAAHIAEKTLKHQAVLARVYDKLLAKGNENAAAAVQRAMEKSLNGHNKALQAITNAQRKGELESKGKKVKDKVEEKIKGPGRGAGKGPVKKEPQE